MHAPFSLFIKLPGEVPSVESHWIQRLRALEASHDEKLMKYTSFVYQQLYVQWADFAYFPESEPETLAHPSAVQLLFLDIDGVLIPSSALSEYPCEDKLALLKKLLDTVPSLRIVVSSSWRKQKHTLYVLIAALIEAGISIWRIVGCVPFKADSAVTAYSRSRDIAAWFKALQLAKCSKRPSLSSATDVVSPISDSSFVSSRQLPSFAIASSGGASNMSTMSSYISPTTTTTEYEYCSDSSDDRDMVFVAPKKCAKTTTITATKSGSPSLSDAWLKNGAGESDLVTLSPYWKPPPSSGSEDCSPAAAALKDPIVKRQCGGDDEDYRDPKEEEEEVVDGKCDSVGASHVPEERGGFFGQHLVSHSATESLPLSRSSIVTTATGTVPKAAEALAFVAEDSDRVSARPLCDEMLVWKSSLKAISGLCVDDYVIVDDLPLESSSIVDGHFLQTRVRIGLTKEQCSALAVRFNTVAH